MMAAPDDLVAKAWCRRFCFRSLETRACVRPQDRRPYLTSVSADRKSQPATVFSCTQGFQKRRLRSKPPKNQTGLAGASTPGASFKTLLSTGAAFRGRLSQVKTNGVLYG